MNKKILIAPLNWGLGHATRCIPIIEALQENGFEPVLAGNGASLELLKKTFPNLIALTLTDITITYHSEGENMKSVLLKQIPRLYANIRKEQKITEKIIDKYTISGIISDNRAGVFSKKVPSVYITHQRNVLSGKTTWLSTFLHTQSYKKFTQHWIPDTNNGINLSGMLGHKKNTSEKVRFIGPLSSLNKLAVEEKFSLGIILSGPEPQRSLLEEKLKHELSTYQKSIVLVRGIVEKEQKITINGNWTVYNFATTEQINELLLQSEKLIVRSGYSTLMDLAKLNKKALLIPTPGQYEQEYLAKKLKKEGCLPSCKQDKFSVVKLDKIDLYSGMRRIDFEKDWSTLFSLF
jgi:uncharacterized protein (TIGR00661 family)